MTDQQRMRSSQEHWRALELLTRYAELLAGGQDAARLYPEVAAHLKQCTLCRCALLDLLAMSEQESAAAAQAPIHAPWFIESEHETGKSTRPGSTLGAFNVLINAPLRFMEPSTGTPRGIDAAGVDGRLLLMDAISIGDATFHVMLTLHEQAGVFNVQGIIAGATRLENANARLFLGDRTYFSVVDNDRLLFENVTIEPDDPRIALELFTQE